MKFILTRHTTTDWNLAGRMQGQTDTSLSEQGRSEAKELAKSFSGLGVNFIVSSDLKRASETAEIIKSFLAAPLELDRRLRECSFGIIEGLTKQQAIEKFGSEIIPHWEDNYRAYDFKSFGGEQRALVLARHLEVLKSLAESKVNEPMLLVGHGRGLNTLLAGLGYSPDLKRGEYRIIEYR